MLDAVAVHDLRRLLEFLAAGAIEPLVVRDVQIVRVALLDVPQELGPIAIGSPSDNADIRQRLPDARVEHVLYPGPYFGFVGEREMGVGRIQAIIGRLVGAWNRLVWLADPDVLGRLNTLRALHVHYLAHRMSFSTIRDSDKPIVKIKSYAPVTGSRLT